LTCFASWSNPAYSASAEEADILLVALIRANESAAKRGEQCPIVWSVTDSEPRKSDVLRLNAGAFGKIEHIDNILHNLVTEDSREIATGISAG